MTETLVALPDHLELRHRRFVLLETAIGAFMSGMVPALAIWLFRKPSPMPLFGSDSLATSLIMATLLPGFGMPSVLTLVIRYRVRAGTAPALGWPIRTPAFLRFMPRSFIVRGLLAMVLTMLILLPLELALIAALGIKTISGTAFIFLNLIHGMALGALILPAIVTLALTDGRRIRAPARAG